MSIDLYGKNRDQISTVSATPPSEPKVPGAFGREPRPKEVAIASDTTGLPFPLLVVVVGRFGVGSLIRFDFFRFRFVHHGHCYLIFSHVPVAEVAFAAA